MAKIKKIEASFTNLEQVSQRIRELGDRTDEILGKVVTEGAKVVKHEVYKKLQWSIGGGESDKSTGRLLAALGISPVSVDAYGLINVKVGFSEPRNDGYTRYGAKTNAMVANILEYGRKSNSQRARPFMKPARAASRKQAEQRMKEVFDEEVSKL